MDFKPTELELQLDQMVREFARTRIQPFVRQWDEQEEFPLPLFKDLGTQGLMGVLVPTSLGGAGLDYTSYVTVISRLASVCGAIGLSVAAHNSLCIGHILKYGNTAQQQKYLPALASGQALGSWALTEAGSGSDALDMKCTALRDGHGWRLNGAKSWITHGLSSQVAVVLARTGKPGDRKGISAFIVERGSKGMLSGKKEKKLGMRASETGEMLFDHCLVPEENLIGGEGEGYGQAMMVLDGGRISIAALALGIAKGAFETALSYSQERRQFGHPISSFQAISFKLADMATRIQAAELLTLDAALAAGRDPETTMKAAIAKYYASETAVEVASEAVQILGANGYSREFPAEKYYRDAKLCTIGEGTSEIQKIIIAREALKN